MGATKPVPAPPPDTALELGVRFVKACTRSVAGGTLSVARGLVGIGSAVVGPIVEDLTPRERIILACGVVYAGGLCYQHGFVAKTTKLADVLLPGWKRLTRVFRKMEEKVDPKVRGRLSLESKRFGSEEQEMTPPKCQCRVGYMFDGDFIAIGCAVRFFNGMLVGPDHVLADSNTEKFARGRQSQVSLKGKDRIPLYTDLVAIKLTEKELSTIGVTECHLGPVPLNGTLTQIVGVENLGTVGRISTDITTFGRLIYEGTTMKGYSGSAYTVGGAVVGIHLMGGAINSGVASKYVWCLMSRVLNVRTEDTADFLETLYEQGEVFTWENGGDPDYYSLHIRGEYHNVTRAALERVVGRDRVLSEGRASTRFRRQGYDDADPSNDFESKDAGEFSSSMMSGASSVPQNSQVSGVDLTLQAIAGYRSLSVKQRKKFQNSLGLGRLPQANTSGQVTDRVSS